MGAVFLLVGTVIVWEYSCKDTKKTLFYKNVYADHSDPYNQTHVLGFNVQLLHQMIIISGSFVFLTISYSIFTLL